MKQYLNNTVHYRSLLYSIYIIEHVRYIFLYCTTVYYTLYIESLRNKNYLHAGQYWFSTVNYSNVLYCSNIVSYVNYICFNFRPITALFTKHYSCFSSNVNNSVHKALINIRCFVLFCIVLFCNVLYSNVK